MIEVAIVFNRKGEVLHWHLPPGRTNVYIPDTRDLWEVLWENRDILGGVAHTHPWEGIPQPSAEDLSTFKAVEAGLGKRLLWPIITFTEVRVFAHKSYCPELAGDGPEDYPETVLHPLHLEGGVVEWMRWESRDPADRIGYVFETGHGGCRACTPEELVDLFEHQKKLRVLDAAIQDLQKKRSRLIGCCAHPITWDESSNSWDHRVCARCGLVTPV